MLPGQPSQTLLRAAIRRAAHQSLDHPRIFEDPVVVGLVPEADDPTILETLDDPGAPSAKLFRVLFAVRNRFAEDRLALAATRGIRQYLMLGAGLDTFAWCQPDFARRMHIFAADLPASLAWTQQRIRKRGMALPPNLTFVPLDLETKQIADRLISYGFQAQLPTFCSALGLTQFLSPEAVGVMLGFASSLSKQSEIVFSFVLPNFELDGDDLSAAIHSDARTTALGEPWRTRLRKSELFERLTGLGFSSISHLSPDLARQRYFPNLLDVPNPPRWEQLIAAIV